MKLLFDHNLSPRLVTRLRDVFPDTAHVSSHSLERATDEQVWEFARRNGFVLVTKDSDFNDLSALRRHPPKVLWLQIGNCTTQQVEELLRRHQIVISEFENDDSTGVLALM